MDCSVQRHAKELKQNLAKDYLKNYYFYDLNIVIIVIIYINSMLTSLFLCWYFTEKFSSCSWVNIVSYSFYCLSKKSRRILYFDLLYEWVKSFWDIINRILLVDDTVILMAIKWLIQRHDNWLKLILRIFFFFRFSLGIVKTLTSLFVLISNKSCPLLYSG